MSIYQWRDTQMWAERGLFSRRATKEKRMTDFSETDIRTALSQVRDPAGDMDIIASGRVQGLVLRGPNVGFSLDVAGLAETALADLQSAAENAARRGRCSLRHLRFDCA